MAHEEQLIFFDYDQSRAQGVLEEKLKDYKGYLQFDGYAGYKQFKENDDIHWLCCMAHARRKFEAALDIDHKRATSVLVKMQRLYRLEHWMRVFQIDNEGKLKLRCRVTVPILDELKKYLDENEKKVAPSEPIAKAIAYTLNLWEELIRYTSDGRLHIDNNLIENKI